ncbi:two pore potassium channel protein sup-9-like [Ptychodera flava]|uniref:two pore potassium channel protein sup-9-like n=1 Tax=Ptychodera flava TaxID=63121 RepID=UPI00396A0CAF
MWYFPREERERRKQKPCCSKSVRSYLVIHCVLLAYVLLGALAFHSLEHSHWEQAQLNTTTMRRRVTEDLRQHRAMKAEEWDTMAIERLLEFEKELESAYQDRVKALLGYSWDYQSAIYFCLTVLSTIGYGQIVPVTNGGKILCVLYALIGIPFFFMYLAKLGELLAVPLKKLYSKATQPDKKFCASGKVPKPAAGSVSPPRNRGPQLHHQGSLGSLTESERHCSLGCSSATQSPQRVQKQDRASAKKANPRKDVQVPIPLMIVVLVGYIMLSALFFSHTQESWSYLDSVYFCTISYTTVGFGDLVPTFGREIEMNHIYVEVFLLFGLILVSTFVHLTIKRMVDWAHILFSDDEEESTEFDSGLTESKDSQRDCIVYVDKATAMTQDEALNAVAL